jgi:hypothetical protein
LISIPETSALFQSPGDGFQSLHVHSKRPFRSVRLKSLVFINLRGGEVRTRKVL